MKLILLNLILCAWVGMSVASASEFTIKPLGTGEGLSSYYVVNIAQDKQGFLWFATEYGLNRFDGSRFHTYYKTDGINGNELNCLVDDPDAPVMWIGTQRDGLCSFNYAEHKIVSYRHDDNNPHSLTTNDITGLCPSPDGNLWISTYWQGIDLLDKKTGRFRHYNKTNVKGLASNHTWCVTDDGNGNLYVGHVNGGMSVIDLKTNKAASYRHDSRNPRSLSGDDVRCVFKDKSGNIWVGSDFGLDLFDPIKKEFIHFADEGRLNRRIFDIQEFDGQLWLATEQGGIAIIDLSRRLFAMSAEPSVRYIREGNDIGNLSGNSIRCLHKDQFDNIWVGMYGGGINVLTTRQPLFSNITYSPYSNEHGLNAKSVLSVCIDKEQNLWMGTDGKGVEVHSPEGRRIKSFLQDGLSTIHASLCDSQGRLWLGSFRYNAYVYASETGTFRRVFKHKNLDVRTFFEDRRQGVMWVGTNNGIFEVDTRTLEVKKQHDFVFNNVRAILKDKKGRIWVGFFGGGLGVYDSNFNLLKQFWTINGFPSNTVNYLYQDRQGYIWVGTGEGLALFTPPKSWNFKVYSTEDGLANTYIRAIAEDADGNLWLSTNKGLSCKRKGSGTFCNFSFKDGIPNGVFNASAVTKGNDNSLYFGSTAGVCHFNPEAVLAHTDIPKVHITGMTIFGKNCEDADSTLSLIGIEDIKTTYKENSFSIRFNIQDYSLADMVEYSYKMKGLDGEWHLAMGNEITFRDLTPGKYLLQVRCRRHNQEWSSELASLEISIAPPFWLSWWAWVCYIACLSAIAWYLLRSYKRSLNLEYLLQSEKREHEQQQELNEERFRFYTNITHELRTPLTLIIGPLEDLAHSDISQKAKHKLAVIHQSAIRLNNLISELLEFRKTETQNRKLCVERGNIVEAVREVSLKYEELNRKDRLNIYFLAPKENIVIYFDKEVVNIIVDNLVSNAIKYTERGEINVCVEQRGTLVNIVVSDTGHGISPEALPHIFDRYYQAGGEHQASGTGIGLSLVRNLVELHHAQIKAESTIDKGSRFIVSLQADYNYPDDLHTEGNKQTITDSNVETEAESSDGATVDDGLKMLVVEDNKEIREYIAESFEGKFIVHKANDGKQGLEMAFAAMPDIIISDVMMPNMDGNKMCHILKNDLRTSHIPIILLTAKDSLVAKEEGYDSGADSYITKPFSRSLLESRINNLLKQRQRLSSMLTAIQHDDHEDKRAILKESLGKMDREFYDSLNKCIEERISGDIDVNYLADKLCMSSSTLYRKIKALTGISTNEYIRKYKMQYAERLMLEGKYNITEVAYMAGFNSINYFRRCFKEEFGEVPSEYLKKLNSGKS